MIRWCFVQRTCCTYFILFGHCLFTIFSSSNWLLAFLLILLEGHDRHEAAIAILPQSMVQTSPKVPQRNGPRGMDETWMGWILQTGIQHHPTPQSTNRKWKENRKTLKSAQLRNFKRSRSPPKMCVQLYNDVWVQSDAERPACFSQNSQILVEMDHHRMLERPNSSSPFSFAS